MNNNYWNLMMNCDFGTEVNPKIYALHDLWKKMEGDTIGAIDSLNLEQVRYINGYIWNNQPSTDNWYMSQTLDLNFLEYDEEGAWDFWNYVERDLVNYMVYAMKKSEEARKKNTKKTRRARK